MERVGEKKKRVCDQESEIYREDRREREEEKNGGYKHRAPNPEERNGG